MGQFKPMVKMMTTEPSVELKLAKGGAVKMKKGGSTTKAKKMAMGGGAMDMMSGTPALVGRPAVNAPVRSPMKPSMASRRKAMMAKKPMAPSMPAMPTMKKGGESKKTHMAEMSKMKGLEKELKSHESKPASKGHKGLKTGGVTDGQGGYKTGGVVLGNGGGYKDGGMPMKNGKPAFLDDGKGMKHGGMMGGGGMHMMPDGNMMKNSAMKKGGMATGGVKMGNAGGFKAGGKTSKKAYATGGTVDSGKPVAMPQGDKKPSQPVSTNRQAGTFKRGGTVMMNGGGTTSSQGAITDRERKTAQDLSKGAYDKTGKYNRELEDAMNPLSMMKELAGKAKDFFMPKGSESVTKTKESVTVSPAGRKRGGMAC